MAPPDDAHDRELSDDGVKLAFAYFEHVERQVALATTTAQLTVAATALLISAHVIAVNGYHWDNNIVTTSIGFLFVGSGVFLVTGFVLALFVAFPNLRTGWKQPDDVRNSSISEPSHPWSRRNATSPSSQHWTKVIDWGKKFFGRYGVSPSGSTGCLSESNGPLVASLPAPSCSSRPCC